MPGNDYHFVTRWHVHSTCEDVSDVLGDPLDLPRWWPTVYLKVEELRSGGAGGLGRRVRLLTKGRLPYRGLRVPAFVASSRKTVAPNSTGVKPQGKGGGRTT